MGTMYKEMFKLSSFIIEPSDMVLKYNVEINPVPNAFDVKQTVLNVEYADHAFKASYDDLSSGKHVSGTGKIPVFDVENMNYQFNINTENTFVTPERKMSADIKISKSNAKVTFWPQSEAENMNYEVELNYDIDSSNMYEGEFEWKIQTPTKAAYPWLNVKLTWKINPGLEDQPANIDVTVKFGEIEYHLEGSTSHMNTDPRVIDVTVKFGEL